MKTNSKKFILNAVLVMVFASFLVVACEPLDDDLDLDAGNTEIYNNLLIEKDSIKEEDI